MAAQFYPVTSLAAGASAGNILAGTPYEFVERAAVRIALKCDDATSKILMTVINGTEVVCQDAPIQLGTAGIVTRDDFLVEFVGRGRLQVVLRSTNAAAKNYWGLIQIQPV